MYEMKKMPIDAEQFCSFSTGDQCEVGDEVEVMWGSGYNTLTMSDIAHLLKGGVIRFVIGAEYNCFVRLTHDDDEGDF